MHRIAERKVEAQFSVKKILAPFLVTISDQTHELARSVKSERPRTALQLKTSFFGCAVAFAVVASVAAGD